MYKKYLSLFALIILASCSNRDESNSYPESKKIDFVEDIYGYEISDSYRWLEDFTSDDAIDWVERQNDFTKKYIGKNKFKRDIGKYLEKICLNKAKDLNMDIEIKQSNIEGDIVDTIQDVRKTHDGIIINAAGYSHTSVAIRDALSIFKKPIIELHISNIYKREDFRHKSLISAVVTGIICGLGINGYILAINSMHEILKNEN